MLPLIPAVSFAPEGSRQVAMTRYPSAAYCLANSTPRPVSHPVTKTVDITSSRADRGFRKRRMTEYRGKRPGSLLLPVIPECAFSGRGPESLHTARLALGPFAVKKTKHSSAIFANAASRTRDRGYGFRARASRAPE